MALGFGAQGMAHGMGHKGGDVGNLGHVGWHMGMGHTGTHGHGRMGWHWDLGHWRWHRDLGRTGCHMGWHRDLGHK